MTHAFLRYCTTFWYKQTREERTYSFSLWKYQVHEHLFLFIDKYILKVWNEFIANFPIYMIHYMFCILLTIIRERITGIYRLIHFIPRLLCMNVCWHGNKNEKYHWCMCEVRNAWHIYWEKRHTRHKHKLVKAVPDEQ